MNKPFLIQTVYRTGTHMLTSAIKQHSRVTFFEDRMSRASRYGLKDDLLTMFQWMRDNTNTEFFGFNVHGDIGHKPPKLRYSKRRLRVHPPLDAKTFWQYLSDNISTCVTLTRRNMIRCTLSTIRAKQTRKTVVYTQSELNELRQIPPMEVNVAKFNRILHFTENIILEMLQRFPRRNMVIYYEDMEANWEETITNIQKWYGLPVEELKPLTLRTTIPDLKTLVTNFDELYDRYRGTQYETQFFC